MAMKKEKFVNYMTNAIIESKNIYEASLIDSGSAYNTYIQRLSQAKVEELYSTMHEIIDDRIYSATDDEIKKYKELKINEIRSEINRSMIIMGNADLEMQKNIKSHIEKLVKKEKELREKDNNEIKEELANELIVAKFNSKDKNDTIVDKVYKDRDTLDKFLNLIEDYKNIKSEIKMLQAERYIIAKDLIPDNIDYISIDNLLSEDRLNNIENIIKEYINLSFEEEEIEKQMFGPKAKEIYFATLKHSEKSIDLKWLKSLKDTIEKYSPRVYEKAVLQLEELERLNAKTFKTDEINKKIEKVKKDISNTKSEINKIIRMTYKEHYENNKIYKPISTRINGKFIYELGYENLNDFFEYGIWPSKDKLKSLKSTRKLNKMESEKAIIRIEIVKSKYSSMYNEILCQKQAKLALIDDKLTKLIGDWKNDEVDRLINNHFEGQQMETKKRK